MKKININIIAGIIGLAIYSNKIYSNNQISSGGMDLELSFLNYKWLIGIVIVTIIFDYFDKRSTYRALSSLVFIGIHISFYFNFLFTKLNYGGTIGSLQHEVTPEEKAFIRLSAISDTILFRLIIITIILMIIVQLNSKIHTTHSRSKVKGHVVLKATSSMPTSR